MRVSGRILSIVIVLIAMQTGSLAAAAGEDHSPEPGQATFKSSCSTCHGPDGAGRTPTGKALQIPDLRSAAPKLTDEEITEIISKGKTGRMPAFGTKLGNEQIQVLVKYIRKLGQDTKASDGK